MSDNRGDAAGYLGWFFLGTLVGAGVALILAPQTGKETRELLAEKGAELAKRAQEVAGDAQVRAGDLFDKGRELFEEQTQRLASAFEAGREAMKEEIGKGRRAE
jgi:gas vesicle protein